MAPPGALWEPLRPGTEILGPDGAPAEGQTPFLYTVETDVIPGAAEDFHAWYEQEHLPGLARVPGCVRARRLVRRGQQRLDGGLGQERHVAGEDEHAGGVGLLGERRQRLLRGDQSDLG